MTSRRWNTVKDLKADLVSPQLVRALDGLVASRHFTAPTADVSSFLEQVLRLGQHGSGSYGFVFQYLAKAVGPKELIKVIRNEKPHSHLALSPGLHAAFEDAFAIRHQTGGKDDFIGARHVLAALLTSKEREIVEEVGLAMEPVGRLDLRPFATALVPILVNALEENEKPDVWRAILRERGFSKAADLMPARPRSTTEPTPEKAEGPNNNPPKPAPEGDHPRLESAFTPQFEPIAGLKNDDPRDLQDADIVGIDDAAPALARVIAAKSFRPPLAVGVFGLWGSGKSFLLRRIQRELARLNKIKNPAFHSEIVEVRFNAWHYVDTNLWANLVGEIFETLDRRSAPSQASKDGVLNRLTTARELTIATARDLAAKRQAALDAKEQLRKAEASFEHRRTEISTHIKAAAAAANAAWATALQDPQANSLVEKAYGKPLAEMAAHWGDSQAALRSLRDDGAVWLAIRRDLGGRAPIGTCVAVVLVLATISLWEPWFSGIAPRIMEIIEKISPFTLAASGLLVTAAGWVAALTRRAVVARDTVIAAVSGYRDAINQNGTSPNPSLSAAREQLEAARVKVEASRAALDEAIGAQANATNALSRDTPAERLRTFIKAKAGIDGPYRSQQGLIGTIRRDFADLSNLMSPQDAQVAAKSREAEDKFSNAIKQLETDFPGMLTAEELEALKGPKVAPSEAEHFDRIVLYIDDLDRCPPDKVLDVLQAVHLLMAFSLFVVIVAVDVRWLKAALEDRHKQFGGDAQDPKAMEYLEKIFQLALWTQPLKADDIGTFIRRRLTPENSHRPTLTLHEQLAQYPAEGVDGDAKPPIALELPPGDGQDTPEGTTSSNEPLLVTEAEIGFLDRISGVLGMTPRRVLRLVNSYQVIRAGLNPSDVGTLLNGGYRSLIGLMSLAVAKPHCVHSIIDAVNSAESWSDFSVRLRKIGDDTTDSNLESWRRILEMDAVTLEDIRAYISLTLRYSFVGPRVLSNS